MSGAISTTVARPAAKRVRALLAALALRPPARRLDLAGRGGRCPEVR